MKIKSINGNDYEEFLDGFFGGGEYGVSRNGKIGFDSQGNVFARKGVSDTDKQLVGLKIQEQKDPMNADTYKRQAAALRKQNPTYTVREDAPLSDFEILKNPQKELSTSKPIQYVSGKPTQQQLEEIKADMDAGKFNGIGLDMLRNGAPGINQAAVPTNNGQNSNNTSAPVKTVQKANTGSGATTTARLEKAPKWMSPLKETNDDIEKRAREYAKELLEKLYRQKHRDWYSGYHEGFSPYDMSELKTAEQRYENTLRNVKDNVALLQTGAKAADIALGYKELKEGFGQPWWLTLIGATYLNEKSQIPGVYDMFNYESLVNNNNGVMKAKEEYDKLNQSEEKYLINSKKHRDIFISRIEDELKNIKNTDFFGYHTQDENDRFKEALITEMMRIMYINYNYDNENRKYISD